MIRLQSVTTSQDVLDKLKEFQAEIDILPTFAEKRAKAKDLFPKKNKKGNKTFDEVKKGLKEMCSGIQRCVYWEDDKGTQVEHIRPKDFFPESCFVWENYVYACDECNPLKNNKFAIFRDDNGKLHEVNKFKDDEPPKGTDVMINPRNENPMDYCLLDLSGTFLFIIIVPQNTNEFERAD
jgi:hypothetical protein